MFQYYVCILLVPAFVFTAAFPWPQPTLVVPEPDNWSPAPTKPPPGVGVLKHLRRTEKLNTCGLGTVFESEYTFVCGDGSFCATHAHNRVHGCCVDIQNCTIATSCIPSTQMSTCGESCLSNPYIDKCTSGRSTECRQWRFVYGNSLVMTEYGCEISSLVLWVRFSEIGPAPVKGEITSTGAVSSPSQASSSSQVTSSSHMSNSSQVSSSPSASNTPNPAPSQKKDLVGAIVGGAIGGFFVLVILILGIVFFVLHSRKQERDKTENSNSVREVKGEMEDTSQSARETILFEAQTTLLDPSSPHSPLGSPVAEVEGREIPVEAS